MDGKYKNEHIKPYCNKHIKYTKKEENDNK